MKERRDLSRLLSGRPRLGRLEKEQILDTVLAEVAPRRQARWWLAVVPAVAAIVVVVLVLGPWRPRAADELAPRGGAHMLGAFKPACTRGCTAGEKLLFDLHGTTGFRYFAAFGQRADGTVLWYFPSDDSGVSIDLAQQPPGGVLDRGIAIGSEHPPGTYRVFGVFSSEPLSRAQLRERFDAARMTAGPGASVIEQELVVR